MFKGDDYSFLDSGEPQAPTTTSSKLRKAIAARFPKMVFEEDQAEVSSITIAPRAGVVPAPALVAPGWSVAVDP